MVIFSPPVSLHVAHRGYDLYAVEEGGCWSVYVYPMRRGMPEFTADQQLIEHPAQEDALAIARNRVDDILASRAGMNGVSDRAAGRAVPQYGRYFFHVRNGEHYPDVSGRMFSSPDEAIEHAALLAAELAQDEGLAGFSIFVTKEDGTEIAQVPVGRA